MDIFTEMVERACDYKRAKLAQERRLKFTASAAKPTIEAFQKNNPRLFAKEAIAMIS